MTAWEKMRGIDDRKQARRLAHLYNTKAKTETDKMSPGYNAAGQNASSKIFNETSVV